MGEGEDEEPIAASAEQPLFEYWLEICSVLEVEASGKNDVYMGGCLL